VIWSSEEPRGAVVLKVIESATLRPGQTFVPMHWGGNTMGGQGVNVLLPSTYDPTSKQPELKHAAIQVAKYTRGQGTGGHAPLGTRCGRPPAPQPAG
jgi:predicted molibdopterin-dependent oxidoreductase YjgC